MVAQGTTLAGRYRLDDRLGAGGMGEVWRGEDIVLARTVAVKVLLPDRMNDPGFAVRFQGEARAMATINHPGVVDVYDYGVTDVPGDGPTAFLVMRFVDGEPLDRLLTRIGRIGPEPAMELIAQAAEAMQAVHERGIVHRDIKPGNLLVRSDGSLILTDFGIARSESATRLTDAGMVLGTAAYCAPEQAEGAPVTPAVDIYALGVVAYECLAGQRPFDGESPVTIALKHIREAPPPLPYDLPPAVRHVVERALAKDPGSRWPSAAAMAVAARQAAMMPGTPSAPFAMPEAPPMGTGAAPQMMGAPGGGGMHGGMMGGMPGGPTGGMHPPATEPSHLSGPTPGSPQGPPPPGGAGRRRRTGMFAGIAVGAALFGGVAAFALNSMADTGGPSNAAVTTSASAADDDTQEPAPSPTATRTRGPRHHTPSQNPRETTRPAHETTAPSSTPTQRPKSPSPTPTPTPKPLRKVPNVVGLDEEQAYATLKSAGLSVKTKISDDLDTGTCSRVLSQSPAAGQLLREGQPVTLVVDKAIECPGDNDQPATPSPVPSPSAS